MFAGCCTRCSRSPLRPVASSARDGSARYSTIVPAASTGTTTSGISATGSLSLAVLPETIACVQTVSLPVTSLAPAHCASLLSLLDQTQGRLDDLRTTALDTSAIAPVRLRMMQLGATPDPDGIGAVSAQQEHERCELWNSVTTALAEQYLADISPVVLMSSNERWTCGVANRLRRLFRNSLTSSRRARSP